MKTGEQGEALRRMGNVRYAEWMDWLRRCADDTSENSERQDELARTVRSALGRLNGYEREALEHYHFMGRQVGDVAECMNLSPRVAERILRSGTLKLRRILGPFVRERFGISGSSAERCPICLCGDRRWAEEIVSSRRSEETWRRVIGLLRREFGMKITSPQTLVGHLKYHMLDGENTEPEDESHDR